MKSSTKLILGIIGAAAVGAAVGMLLAPEKGSEMRNKVKSKAGEFADSIAELFSEAKEEISGITGKVKSKANEMAHSMKG
jgi:gas vesicle protein